MSRLHEACPEYHCSSETWGTMRGLIAQLAGIPHLAPHVKRGHVAHVRRNFRVHRDYLTEQAKTRPEVGRSLDEFRKALQCVRP